MSNGTFHSPNYPVPYETNVDCILYTFVGGQDELVQITFVAFRLQEANENGRYTNRFLNYRSFATLDDDL